MTARNGAFAFFLLAVLFLDGRAMAQDVHESMALGSPAPISVPSVTEKIGPWELQFYWGEIVPLKKNTFSYDIPNAKVFDLLAGEAVGDEVAEGFVMPPIPGNSTVAGSLKNFSEVGVQLFYQIHPGLDVGAQFGYGLKRDLYIDSRGIYTPDNFLKVEMQANIYHLNAPVRLSTSYGPWRPHLLLGPGIYFTQERVRLSFNDSDDPQLKPQYVIAHDTEYFGIDTGVGLDYAIGECGRLGIDLQYHKVFSPLGKFDFILPKASFGLAF